MTGPDEGERLRALDERIRALKSATSEEKPHQEEHYSQAQHAWRMVIELVAGIAIGFGIGYGLDSLFGTLPIRLSSPYPMPKPIAIPATSSITIRHACCACE